MEKQKAKRREKIDLGAPETITIVFLAADGQRERKRERSKQVERLQHLARVRTANKTRSIESWENFLSISVSHIPYPLSIVRSLPLLAEVASTGTSTQWNYHSRVEAGKLLL